MARRSWLLGAAAVFVLALGWFFTRPQGTLPADPTGLLEQYVTEGRRCGQLLEQLPNVTLEVRPVMDRDGVEVIYLRRFVERRVVHEAWQIGSDEHGRPQPERVDVAALKATSSL